MYEKIPFDIHQVSLKNSFYVNRSFAQKHSHALHQHNDVLELLYLYDGNGRYQISSQEYAVSEGDLLICNQNVLHGERFLLENNISTYCISLYGLSIPSLPPNHLISDINRPIVKLTKYQHIIHEIMPQIHELKSVKQQNPEIALSLSQSVLMMVWDELLSIQQTRNYKERFHAEQLLRKMTSYLDEHYTDPQLRMSEICDQLHISESYLSHAFKKETGLSPKQYIILRRVGEAQSLLENTNIPINQIETSLGFSSSVHLTSTFRKYVGISPREYRAKFREEQLVSHAHP